MFITRKHISRRTLLRGASASLALPFLDAMVPAATALANTAAASKPRLGFFYFPHGAIMEKWKPEQVGTDFGISPILEPLAPFKKHLTVVSNIGNRPGESRAVHALVPGTWLSCVHPRETNEPNMAPTVDQIAAQHIGQDTPWPSLETGTAQGQGQGSACERGYGCSYSGTLSFRNASTPLPIESNARNLFLRLFGQGDTARERQYLMQQTNSLLDMIAEETNALSRTLSARDRATLGDYLDNVREVERRVNNVAHSEVASLELPEVPGATSQNFDERLALMFDLIALAYQADLTRVATYVMAAEGTDRPYPNLNVAGGFHPVSHHANQKERIAELSRIQRFHMEKFAGFIKKLADSKEGEGSILDHSLFLYGSNMGNSNQHDNYPLPEVLVGGANGKHVGGKNLALPERTPLANLHLTMLDKLGIQQPSFGNSTGLLSQV